MLGILIFVLILAFRSGQKVPPVMLAVLVAALAVTAGLGLYLGLADPALTNQDVMEDPKIQAALNHGNDVIPEDGKLTPGPWVLLQKTGSDRTYSPTYCSKGRLTRKVLEKLQTVVIASDSQIIDSGEYVFEQYGKQVGSSFTLHRYRVRLWYYDVQKGKVVRVDVVDGSPLKEDGSGGGISKSEIVRTVKVAMAESAR